MKPSGYVSTILKPLSEVEEVTGEHREEWYGQIIENVTEKLVKIIQVHIHVVSKFFM